MQPRPAARGDAHHSTASQPGASPQSPVPNNCPGSTQCACDFTRTSALDGAHSPLLAFMRCSPSPLHPVTPSSPRLCSPAPPRRVSCKASNYCSPDRHTQHFKSCAVRKNTHAKTWHQCGQKRHTHKASKVVRSEKTHTRKAGTSAVRKDTHTQSFESCAVRKDTHAKSWHQCGQKRHTHATLNCVHTKASKFLRSADRGDTWKYCGQSGTTAVRKDTQARLQILCGQKRHECKTTLLRTAKPTLLWSHVLALTTGRHVTTQNQKNSSSSPSHILCNSSGVFPKVKSNWAASSSLISAKAAASNFSWRSRSILSSSSLTPSP